jgi:hypothetical protein
MGTRKFIGPNGAKFAVSGPLPLWLERRLEAGEVTEEGSPKRRSGKSKGSSKAEEVSEGAAEGSEDS